MPLSSARCRERRSPGSGAAVRLPSRIAAIGALDPSYNFRTKVLKYFKLQRKTVEARVGFEPTNGGFADLSLGPLGYRATAASKYSEKFEIA